MAMSFEEQQKIQDIIFSKFDDLDNVTDFEEQQKIQDEIFALFAKLDEAIEQNPDKAAENEKLARLKAGDYDNLSPADFIKILREIVDEINDIEQVKIPAVNYIDKRVKKA